jgi:hypothetical protein
MARRTWIGTIAILLLTWILFAAGARHRESLRSRHAEPARQIPAGEVLVVADGKLFHRAGCTYMHGTPQAVPGADAVQRGYTPCVRCEAKLLRR